MSIKDFIEASRSSNATVIERIIGSKPELINTYDRLGNTALYNASENGKLRLVRFILDHGADPNLTNNKQMYTPLYVAAEHKYTEIVQALLESGADPNIATRHGETSLYAASSRRYLDIMRALIQSGADTNKPMNGGHTPLHVASEKGHYEAVQLLIENGANPVIENEYGNSPLHVASEQRVVELLLANGADINKTNHTGYTPLHIASQKGRVEVVRALLDAGADIGQENHDGNTPLNVATQNRHNNVVQLLRDRGAGNLPRGELPTDAPTLCTDPIMLNDEVNIASTELTTFYIENPDRRIVKAACINEDVLNLYKTRHISLYYRVKNNEPVRALDLETRMFVKDSHAQLLMPGKKYILRPKEPLGQVITHEGFHAPGSNSFGQLYEIHQIVEPPTGGRRRRRTMRKLHKNRNTRRVR